MKVSEFLKQHGITRPEAKVCLSCLGNDGSTYLLPGGVLATYCVHTRCGATYWAPLRRWTLYPDIDRDQWLDSIAGALVDVNAAHSPPAPSTQH